MGQNIVTELDAWLTFFSCTDAEHIVRLVQEYPKFLEYYKDIAVFRTNPKELIYMFSEALEILDRNTANGPMSRLWTQKVELFSPYLIARRDVSYAARASSSTCCGVL